jgi:hypothetical protein
VRAGGVLAKGRMRPAGRMFDMPGLHNVDSAASLYGCEDRMKAECTCRLVYCVANSGLLYRIHGVLSSPSGSAPTAWVFSRSLAGIVGSNLSRVMSIRFLLVLYIVRWGLCVGLITRPGKFYKIWRVWVRSSGLDIEEALVHQLLLRSAKNAGIK